MAQQLKIMLHFLRFTGSAWVSLDYGTSGSWSVGTVVYLANRSDTHLANRSPITSAKPLYTYVDIEINLRHFLHNIKIMYYGNSIIFRLFFFSKCDANNMYITLKASILNRHMLIKYVY